MKSGIISTASRFFLSTDGAARGEAEFIQTFPSRERGRRRSMLSGTVFQTALFSSVIIPRLRPGLLSLRSVLSSRQQTTNNQQPTTDNQQPTTNQITILYKRYGNANAKSYTIEPYCIKLHKQRWYVLGHFHYTNNNRNVKIGKYVTKTHYISITYEIEMSDFARCIN